jgi:hypothetical protein
MVNKPLHTGVGLRPHLHGRRRFGDLPVAVRAATVTVTRFSFPAAVSGAGSGKKPVVICPAHEEGP